MSKVNKNTLDFIDKIALTCKNTEVEYRLLNSVQYFTGAEILYYIKNYKVHDHKALCEYIFKHGGIEDIVHSLILCFKNQYNEDTLNVVEQKSILLLKDFYING